MALDHIQNSKTRGQTLGFQRLMTAASSGYTVMVNSTIFFSDGVGVKYTGFIFTKVLKEGYRKCLDVE